MLELPPPLPPSASEDGAVVARHNSASGVAEYVAITSALALIVGVVFLAAGPEAAGLPGCRRRYRRHAGAVGAEPAAGRMRASGAISLAELPRWQYIGITV